MSAFRIFLLAFVTAFVVTNSFHLNSKTTYRSRCERARVTTFHMTVTTDELAVAYDQIKQQVRSIFLVVWLCGRLLHFANYPQHKL